MTGQKKRKHWTVALLEPNTLRTTAGYVRSLFERTLNLKGVNSLEGIYNYLPVDESLSSSGQPSVQQFEAIQKAGFTQVINLAPHDVENSIADEQSVVEQLGMTYSHIPVDFKKPTEEDYRQFTELMNAARASETQLWVHCAANMRVSAFLYRYRLEQGLEDEEGARARLHRIWTPFGVWERFVQRAVAKVTEE